MIILFDGVCNFCNSSVNLIIKLDKKDVFKFAALQSNFGQTFLKKHHKNLKNFDSIILIENNNMAYYKAEAFFRIIKQLQFPINLLIILKILPLNLLNYIYEFIAKNRYSIFGKKDSCLIPSKELISKFLD